MLTGHTVVRSMSGRRHVVEKQIYVVGHRNPDTDSIVSAIAYAELRRQQGLENCVPIRAGKTTPQTEYILQRFGVPVPMYVPDIIPKVRYYFNPNIKTIQQDKSLWEAMSLLQSDSAARALPVVDADGRYHSLVHYSHFAQKLVHLASPQQKTTIQTSVDLLATVLHAQTLVSGPDSAEVRKSPIVVAAAEFETFSSIFNAHIPRNTIVITGNREDIHAHAIDRGVRALIITNGYMLDRKLRQTAQDNGVSVLVSPYDTSSTTLLLMYSIPVGIMANADLKPVRLSDPVRKVQPLLTAAPGKALPVVDENDRVVGVLSESDLYRDANIEVIMVDHNEHSQAIEGIENYTVLEVIDHHRVGDLTSKTPITFINKPVGATCTIVARLYQESRVPLSQEIASILLCGILADTLALQSATTTREDFLMAEFLANITNLDIAQLGREILSAASRITGRSAGDLIHQDLKKYDEKGFLFNVSQIEVENENEVLRRKDEFIAVLEQERAAQNMLFCALLVTNIVKLTSILVIAADEKFVPAISLPKAEDNVYVMQNIVSRKKQLMPILSELVAKYSE